MPSVSLTRRQYLWMAAPFAATPFAAAPSANAQEPTILVHEHVLVDFIGASRIHPGRYDADDAFRVIKPYLDTIARLGCKRFQECTPNYLGRNPALLRRLEDATGIEMWTNTGLYAARNHIFLPDFAHQESAAQLAARWIEESRKGVDGMKPRFLKIGVNRGPLGELDRKIVRAGAICSRETGLTIASHTGDGAAALEQLEIVQSEKVKPEKFVWVHANSEKDHGIHRKMAQSGAWVEFDGISEKQAGWHLECVGFMSEAGLLHRTLISQDAGWYRPGEPDQKAFRGYDFLYSGFLPKLDSKTRRQLMWDNPRAAFG
jgi:phosphotriesterase-related protein